jgi:DNA-binding NtrC family response regulator
MSEGPGRALVVLQERGLRDEVTMALAHVGFVVTEVGSFEGARRALPAGWDVLVTDLELAEYNGLHLILRARAISPGLAAVVTSPARDAVLQREAEAIGATFVAMPVTAHELMVAVLRTVHHAQAVTDRGPVRGPFERRSVERRQSTRAVAAEIDRRVQRRRGTDRDEKRNAPAPP